MRDVGNVKSGCDIVISYNIIIIHARAVNILPVAV